MRYEGAADEFRIAKDGVNKIAVGSTETNVYTKLIVDGTLNTNYIKAINPNDGIKFGSKVTQ